MTNNSSPARCSLLSVHENVRILMAPIWNKRFFHSLFELGVYLGKKRLFYEMTSPPPLNWQTDPLLLDLKPAPVASWRTLNDLLQNGDADLKQKYSQQPLWNIFGVVVRKIDFVNQANNPSSNERVRILTRMPFLPLDYYRELKESLEATLWATAEAGRNYFYKSALNDASITSWKKRLERYLERKSIPLALVRIQHQSWHLLNKRITKEQKILLQSAKGERSTIPLVLTEKLVYILGIIDGDGHLKKHMFHIVDYSREQVKQLLSFCQELFQVKGDFKEGKTGNYFLLFINSKWVVRFVNFLTGHTFGRKYHSLREPLFLREQRWSHFRGAYWRGLFDADASYRRTMVFSSISEKVISDLQQYFSELEVKFRVKETFPGISMYVYSGSRQKVAEAIGSWHPEKKKELQTLLSRRRNGEIEAFQGIRTANLTSEGFFDFSLMDQRITVLQMGDLLKQFRWENNWSRTELANSLQLSYFTLTSYEKNRTNPPLQLVQMLASKQNMNLMPFLHKNNLCRFGSVKKVKLPLRPSKQCLELMQYLRPGANHAISLETNDQEVTTKLNDFFELKITDPAINRLYNYVLWTFLTTYGNYQTVK